MTELDVPRPILMDVNRIRDYFDIIRIVAEKIGEDRAYKGFHTTTAVRARVILAPEEWARKITPSPYLETTITGISLDLQYRKNSLKPESSLISVGSSFEKNNSLRYASGEGVLSLSAFLHSSNVCPFWLTLSNISRKASLHGKCPNERHA